MTGRERAPGWGPGDALRNDYFAPEPIPYDDDLQAGRRTSGCIARS
jgi:hypothetical protein